MNTQANEERDDAYESAKPPAVVRGVDPTRFQVSVQGGYISITSRLFRAGNIAYVRVPESQRFSLLLIGSHNTGFGLRLQPLEMTQLDKDPSSRGTIIGLVHADGYPELEAAWMHLRNLFMDLDAQRETEAQDQRKEAAKVLANHMAILEHSAAESTRVKEQAINPEQAAPVPAIAAPIDTPTPELENVSFEGMQFTHLASGPLEPLPQQAANQKEEQRAPVTPIRTSPVEGRTSSIRAPWWAVAALVFGVMLGGLFLMGNNSGPSPMPENPAIVPLR